MYLKVGCLLKFIIYLYYISGLWRVVGRDEEGKRGVSLQVVYVYITRFIPLTILRSIAQ